MQNINLDLINDNVDILARFNDIITTDNTVTSKPKFKEHIIKIYTFGKEWIVKNNLQNLNPQNIMQLTTNLMSVVQTLQYQDKLKDANRGEYKKTLVETVIKMLLTDHGVVVPVGMTIDNVMDFTINHLVPSVIETAIEIASGHVDIKKTVKRVSGCIGFCKDKRMCERTKKNKI
jgi:hypothetical protein